MANRKECVHYADCSYRNEFGRCAYWCMKYKHRDEVRVVRCKNCDWYREDGSICVNPHCTKSFYGCRVLEQHFCSYGERKGNG